MELQDWLDRRYRKEKQLNLITLDCSNIGLTSLKGIENIINLKYLDCSYNKLTSLKGIENLVNLEYLHFYNNPLPYKSEDLKGILKELNAEIRKEKIKNLLL